MTPTPVTVRYRKHDGSPHWRHEMARLGTDSHGVWLWADSGGKAWRPNGSPLILSNPFLQLVPPNSYWTAIFNGPHARTYGLYIDLCTPARWTDDAVVEMVDMDLDVVRRVTGEVEVLDEDEFSAHSTRFGYPHQLVATVRTTAAELVLAVERSREPFGTVWESWWEVGSEE